VAVTYPMGHVGLSASLRAVTPKFPATTLHTI